VKDSRQVSRARSLRRNLTDAERILWSRLRSMQIEGIKFRRQEPIGTYIVDSISYDKRLVVEIDGGQHNDEQAIEKDRQRTIWLEHEGFRVIRFWNNEVLLNLDGVMIRIMELLK